MTCLFLNNRNLYSGQKIFLPMQTQHTIHVFIVKICEEMQLCRIRSPPSNLDF